MFALVPLVIWLALVVIGGVVSTWLVRRVRKRGAELPLAVRALAILVALAVAYGVLGTVVGVVHAFGALSGEGVDPSQKARILAEGIAEAMNCAAFALIIWVPSAIAAFVLGRPRKDSNA